MYPCQATQTSLRLLFLMDDLVLVTVLNSRMFNEHEMNQSIKSARQLASAQ